VGWRCASETDEFLEVSHLPWNSRRVFKPWCLRTSTVLGVCMFPRMNNFSCNCVSYLLFSTLRKAPVEHKSKHFIILPHVFLWAKYLLPFSVPEKVPNCSKWILDTHEKRPLFKGEVISWFQLLPLLHYCMPFDMHAHSFFCLFQGCVQFCMQQYRQFLSYFRCDVFWWHSRKTIKN